MRRAIEPIADKIRRGEISVFVAVAEELPEVFRTHVVPKLELLDTLALACVNKSYNSAVWSVEGVRSIEGGELRDALQVSSAFSTDARGGHAKQLERVEGPHRRWRGPEPKARRTTPRLSGILLANDAFILGRWNTAGFSCEEFVSLELLEL